VSWGSYCLDVRHHRYLREELPRLLKMVTMASQIEVMEM